MIQRVVCIGAGFVGGPFGAMIAYQCPDIQVAVVDKDPRRIEAWNSDCLPMYEPGLDDILASIRQRPVTNGGYDSNGNGVEILCDAGSTSNLRFSTDIERAIGEADIIVLCIDTPTKTFGTGQGIAADLANLQAAVKTIARVADTDKIVVEKSTVPCGTAEVIRDLLHECSTSNAQFEVLSNPEFLSEGTTIANLLHPSRVLIGSQQTPSGSKAAATFAAVYEAWVPPERIKMMDCWSSELSKLAANAMLAQRLSSINSLSAICEAGGGDVQEVATACGLDPRLGPEMMRSGLGWGGGCFEKDILDLVYIARSLELDAVANYWMAVVEMNDLQKTRFLRRIQSCMHGSLRGKAIAVLGFAFKKDTSDTKGSPAIPVVQGLLAEGAHVAIYDPMVPASQIQAALGPSSVRIYATAYEACYQAEAVVVVTDWDEFRMGASPSPSPSPLGSRCLTPDSSPETAHACLDWQRIAQDMQRPRFVFDGRNMLPGERIGAFGCRYVRVGRTSQWDAWRMKRYPFHY